MTRDENKTNGSEANANPNTDELDLLKVVEARIRAHRSDDDGVLNAQATGAEIVEANVGTDTDEAAVGDDELDMVKVLEARIRAHNASSCDNVASNGADVGDGVAENSDQNFAKTLLLSDSPTAISELEKKASVDDPDDKAWPTLAVPGGDIGPPKTTVGMSASGPTVLEPGAYALGGINSRAPSSDRGDIERQEEAPPLAASEPDHSGLMIADPVQDEQLDLPLAVEEDPEQRIKSAENSKKQALTIAVVGVVLIVTVMTIALVFPLAPDAPSTSSSSNKNSEASHTNGIQSQTDLLLSLLPDSTKRKMIAQDPSSPQSKAFDWVLGDPSLDTYLYNDNIENWRLLQRFALATLYYATDGPNSWFNATNWLSYEHHECQWMAKEVPGFCTCQTEDNRNPTVYPSPCGDINDDINTTVAKQQQQYKFLLLNANGLQGTIPDEVSWLTSLERLELVLNDISGTIPEQLGQLTLLRSINIEANKLTGEIPSAILSGATSTLQNMSFAHNLLGGTLASALGQLTDLRYMAVEQNKLTGSIPTTIGNCTSLVSLELSENRLSGPLPSEIGRMSLMADFRVFGNQLTGSIPTEVGLMNSAFRFYTDNNSMAGPIPSEFGILVESLGDLYLYGNQYTGMVPSELGQLTNLFHLGLNDNSLTGTLATGKQIPTQDRQCRKPEPLDVISCLPLLSIPPVELGNLTSLKKFEMENNQLQGTIMTEVGRLSKLLRLRVYNNSLSGSLPSELVNAKLLRYIHVEFNKITGTIPSQFGGLQEVKIMSVNDNNLMGSLPSELGLMTFLQRLRIQNNNFSGSIPAELELVANSSSVFFNDTSPSPGNLTELNLTGNALLTGMVPHMLCNLAGYFDFDCSDVLCGCNCNC